MRGQHHVPAVGRPLVGEPIAIVAGIDHAALQAVVDAGVVVGKQHTQALAHLQRERLRLELLRVAFGERELAFEGENLGGVEAGGAGVIPECRLPCGRGDADSGGSTVHVVGEVGGFRVARERADAALFRLREERMIGEADVLQQRGQRARAAAESKRVDGQHGGVRIDVVAAVARLFEPARQRLPEDHPQGVARRNAVARGHHESVAVGMLGTPVIVAQPAEVRPGEVQRDIVRRVRQRSAEMAGLGIIAQHDQRHAGHVSDIFDVLEILGGQRRFRRRYERFSANGH